MIKRGVTTRSPEGPDRHWSSQDQAIMSKVLRPAGTTAIAAAVLVAIVLVSSAVPTVSAGRLGLRATMMTTTKAAMKPDQMTTTAMATTDSSAGPSGCSNSPNNDGTRCPNNRQISSTNPSNQTAN